MGLLQKCCETYDNHLQFVGVIEGGKEPLVPIAHSMKNADLEITIDNKGVFVAAQLIDKSQQDTIIPVTIASGGRSGKDPAAHPLCDKLQYMLKSDSKKNKDYIEQLEQWANSSHSTSKLKAILYYVKTGTIAIDLYNSKITTSTIPSKSEEGLFIRWRVEGLEDGSVAECWRDKKLFDSWTNYYLGTLKTDKNFCMISGEEDVVTENHPKNIISIAANAKLLSANDNTNFTFRGRFATGVQASTIGYVSSQKAHNALRWQASRGRIIGGRIFICWNPQGIEIPLLWSPFVFEKKTELMPSDYAKEIKDTITGYRNAFSTIDTSDVVIASLDAATTGRLSLTYYNELKASDFLDRVEYWYQTCCWKGRFGTQCPSIFNIVKAAYGLERSETGKIDVDDVLSRDHQQRLFKCIIEKMPISYDLVQSLLHKASRPESYNTVKYYNYENVLFVACAIIRKYLNDKLAREEWTLEIDKEKIERSYLFGRLLAIFEKIELDTYDKEETREPNAIRLQSAYCEKPLYYANIINTSLNPYFARLSPGRRAYYKKIIGEVMEKLANYSDRELNKALTETYLLGYYLQRNDFYKSKKEDATEVKGND